MKKQSGIASTGGNVHIAQPSFKEELFANPAASVGVWSLLVPNGTAGAHFCFIIKGGTGLYIPCVWQGERSLAAISQSRPYALDF